MAAVVVAAVLLGWAALAWVCDWVSRRPLAPPKVKPEPERPISSGERVAAFVKDEAEIEAEVAVGRPH